MKIKVIFLIIILLPIFLKSKAQTPAKLVEVTTRFINTLSVEKREMILAKIYLSNNTLSRINRLYKLDQPQNLIL
jgi:hypothetical protein